MAYLYQQIRTVPGLTGSDYERQKQLYERMGSPQGPYRGTYDQNIWLQGQITSGAAQRAMQPVPTPTPTPTPTTSVADKITNPITQNLPKADTPTIDSMTSYWDRLKDLARGSATEVVEPEISRGYETGIRGLLNQLASSGAGQFGGAGGVGQMGSLGAETIRNREGMIQDMLESYRKGFEELWYNPTLESWANSYLNKNQTPSGQPTAPSWEDFGSLYGGVYGNNQITVPQTAPIPNNNLNPMFPPGTITYNTPENPYQNIINQYGSKGRYDAGFMPNDKSQYLTSLKDYNYLR